MINTELCCHVSAERRAQLSRSRSRQNLFQTSAAPDVVREINFDDDKSMLKTNEGSSKMAALQHRKPRSKGDRGAGGGVGSMSEAEELLKRLKEL